MSWLTNHARFTLIYKHLSSRNLATPIDIPKQWQQPLQHELSEAKGANWYRSSGYQKLLRVVSDKASAGLAGLQPKHWFQACTTVRRTHTRFGQLIIIIFLLILSTLVHTDYLLLEFRQQFVDAGQSLPPMAAWLADHGKQMLFLILAVLGFCTLVLKCQHRGIRRHLEQLNLYRSELVPGIASHCNIAITGFWLSKLDLEELAHYLPASELSRLRRLNQRHELGYMSRDTDCAELLWQRHIQAALKASLGWQRRLTVLAYIILFIWFGLLTFGAMQAFLAWGRLNAG